MSYLHHSHYGGGGVQETFNDIFSWVLLDSFQISSQPKKKVLEAGIASGITPLG